ncbi:hypothetical protein OsJ_17372 [Oryza sativa Japonica Group]|uniref:Uncharacterized protein n=2 Tax=Oryza TaxID=4527 RepID=B9FI91_ORYSJ|nr:hypothetical protein OsJ_17372 [Oryza sativa Japonica Group]
MVEAVEEVHGSGRYWSPTAPTTERGRTEKPRATSAYPCSCYGWRNWNGVGGVLGRWWWRCCAASSPLPPLELHLRVSYAEPEYARWMLSRSPSSVVHRPPGAATAGEHLASAGIALSSKMLAMPCLAGEKRKRDGG